MGDEHKVYLDESGIVIADYRFASLAATPETVGRTREKIVELCPGRKVPLLVLVDVARGMGAELEEAVRQMAAVVTKVAMVTSMPAAVRFADDFRKSAMLPFPHRTFENETDARAWLLAPEC
jgi:SpoIIAA-like